MDKSEKFSKPNDDGILNEVNETLAFQISAIIEENRAAESKMDKADSENNTKQLRDEVNALKVKRLPKGIKISGIVLTIFFVLGLVLVVGVKMYLGRINYESDKNTTTHNNSLKPNEESDKDSEKWDTMLRNAKKVDGIINILLIGIEAINTSGDHGRTDTIMIATINSKEKSIKLTSVMRDIYVQIPGYQDNRINAAYGLGGIGLLKETIAQNFNIEIDGYVSVDFEGFEKLIDKLGGVEVTLTEKEADYLNRTNYISDKSQRNVKVGKQKLNGTQARGYCRIRKVPTENNSADDFGRTYRQRAVITAVFDNYKSKSLPKLLSLIWDGLPYITTDIKQQDLINYTVTVASSGFDNLETFRLPVNNGYKGEYIRKMAVLVPDIEKNVQELHDFIYGVASEGTNKVNNDDN
ncbi:LCP family protein [Anaerocolumna jejuensis]|uniref:LCP family protein n=1 Tax=Anaerocolumna jejuensis TaxID=259063 RepID=UPI003F7C7E4F